MMIALAMLFGAGEACAQQQMLANRSFETTPTPTVDGNNFFTAISGWTTANVSPAQAQPVNIIRPFATYGGGPTTVAPGDTGGVNYFDVNSASGVVRQTITLPSPGTVAIGGWFSTRDGVRTLSGMQIRLLGTNLSTVHASTSVSFTTADPAFTWKQVPTATSGELPAGSYVFEIVMPNEANADLMSAVFTPRLTVTKVGTAWSDPVNGTANPKQIPGGVTEYLITASTQPGVTVTADTINVVDLTPAGMDLVVTNIGAGGSGPAAFAANTSGLTYSFGGLASTTDRIDFSNNGGSTWTYVPVANGNGVDPNVSAVRIRPGGGMAQNSSFSLRLRYRLE